MKLESRRAIFCATGTLLLCLFAAAGARSQAAKPGASPKPPLSEEVFKNIQVLRGIPVDEFMGTMGFFAASLNMNCIDCHVAESAGNWDKYADDTPLKNTARRMVLMENLINRADFGNTRLVTCYTCHRGFQKPEVVPSLAEEYGPPPTMDPDRLEVIPGSKVPPGAAEKILDKFIQAVGGVQQLAKLTSFTAKGTYAGFDTDFMKVPAEVYAQAPNLRSTVDHLSLGDATSTFDGNEAWIASIDKPVPQMILTAGDLDGARLDAQLAFPATIKETLTNWHAGFPPAAIGSRTAQVVEGTAPGGTRVKLFFDKESGLLLRQTRLVETVVGLTPLDVEYSDYRLVSGVKIPFKWTTTWVDGRSTTELTTVQPNAKIAAEKFAKPAPAVEHAPAAK